MINVQNVSDAFARERTKRLIFVLIFWCSFLFSRNYVKGNQVQILYRPAAVNSANIDEQHPVPLFITNEWEGSSEME